MGNVLFGNDSRGIHDLSNQSECPMVRYQIDLDFQSKWSERGSNSFEERSGSVDDPISHRSSRTEPLINYNIKTVYQKKYKKSF